MYIVMEIQTQNDGTVGTLVWSFADRLQAERQYHLILASAAISELACHAATLLNNDGREVVSQCYRHATIEPEEEISENEEMPEEENIEEP